MVRSVAVLHPTFEEWGGAEYFIHHVILTAKRLRGVRVDVYTHRWSDPPGETCDVSVHCHRRGGVLSYPWDWQRIAREYASEWRSSDVLFINNYPATAWYAAARADSGVPPAVWYCHEPPRALHPASEIDASGARPAAKSFARYAAAAGFYGTRAPRRLASTLRAAVARRRRGAERWADDLRRADIAAVARMARIVSNSAYTADRVRRVYGRESTVVHPVPPGLDRFAPPAAHVKEPLVLWVGRMTDAKRPDVLVQAWARARRVEPGLADFRLALIGRGPLRQRVERMIDEEGLGGAVEIRSNVERSELIDWYRRALLTVHLGISEPFGLVPLESMAAGTPVLAQAGGGVGETIVDGTTGWRVANLDVDRLAERLARVAGQAPELRSMSPACVRHVRSTFDHEACVATLLDVFDEACGNEAGS